MTSFSIALSGRMPAADLAQSGTPNGSGGGLFTASMAEALTVMGAATAPSGALDPAGDKVGSGGAEAGDPDAEATDAAIPATAAPDQVPAPTFAPVARVLPAAAGVTAGVQQASVSLGSEQPDGSGPGAIPSEPAQQNLALHPAAAGSADAVSAGSALTDPAPTDPGDASSVDVDLHRLAAQTDSGALFTEGDSPTDADRAVQPQAAPAADAGRTAEDTAAPVDPRMPVPSQDAAVRGGQGTQAQNPLVESASTAEDALPSTIPGIRRAGDKPQGVPPASTTTPLAGHSTVPAASVPTGQEAVPAVAPSPQPQAAAGFLAAPIAQPEPTGAAQANPAQASPAVETAHVAAAASTTAAAAAVPTPAAPAIIAPAPTAPPSAPMHAAPQGAPLAAQVSGHLVNLAKAGRGEHVMTVTVTPDSLGPVTVRAHVGPEGVRVELFAPNDLGRDALRAILPDLRRDLAGTGTHSQLDLSAHDQPTADDRGGFGNQRRQPAAGDAEVATRSPAQAETRPASPDQAASASTIDVMV